MSSTLTAEEPFSLTASRRFVPWLQEQGGSIAFTTYQAGKIIFLGQKPDGRMSIFDRTFPRAMGLGVSQDGRALLLASHYQIHRFNNVLEPGQLYQDHDALFVPHQSWITGDVDAHDIGFGPDGRPVFANTMFSCLATTQEGHSFAPMWKPDFVSKLAAEDRCHLNGMALDQGVPRYVTCVSRSDVADGWRDRRGNGGLVLDVQTGKTVAEGLSMPHSPRLHQGKLWLLNSGSGELGWIDIDTGAFHPIAFCPGYPRGLSLVGDYAIVGLSLARENKTFQGLALEAALADRDAEARCGLAIIDLRTGDTVATARIEGPVRELYDVVFLENLRCPAAIGFKGSEIETVISIGDA